MRVAFPPVEELRDTLGEVVSRAGLRQLRVAESEKAIHVGYFLAGKRQELFAGEERVTPQSPREPLAEPEMRATEVAAAVEAGLADPAIALIVANLANIDVIGHHEDRSAVLRAVEAVDAAVGRLVEAAHRVGVAVVVTADHGTVERWLYPEGTIDTGHTNSPVPCMLAMPAALPRTMLRGGRSLVDVAPTVLDLLGLATPPAMTGRSLLEGPGPRGARRVLLLVCDGWGVAPAGPANLISQTRTPAMDRLAGNVPTHAARRVRGGGGPADRHGRQLRGRPPAPRRRACRAGRPGADRCGDR